ncbi:isoleucine--tRNA ligase [Microseira wollei]|uniref:Isoleucine--tRNA ligase n=1 Tax=Microseira wollei NIES-4236 TaxID=2530354 RepID=A0AAV3X473_9CYAN|nr:isoleucine--tRNA ligase [Microseira wollei]GET37073.1 isoleucyl-tRNA synthetase [Microseira wollei NIES-4236]
MTEAKTYKDTVNLPKTDFDMRANAVKREPEIQKFWAENQIYEKLSQNNPGDLFILHDGPPYANGSLHLGHALNKILKDIINKYQLLRGRKVRYVPGWDCHGLPIELKVLQQLKQEERQKLKPLELRHKARDFALKAVDEQRESFKRYGVWGDWENPYLTLKPEYEAAQIGVFGQMVLKGYIYRGLKPVHWSPSSKTALAEAELEYPEGHTSPSIYVAFPMTDLPPALKLDLEDYLPDLGVAVWTTTPWTIPANLAVSVNPELTYAVVEIEPQSASTPEKEEKTETKPSLKGKGKEKPSTAAPEAEKESQGIKFKYLLVAADLVDRLSSTLGSKLHKKAMVTGKDLEGATYRHPLFDRSSQIVIGGDYVTTESGTGLVHTAPGHGLEDYMVGQRYNLPILSPVDADGKFTAEAGQFAGLSVVTKGDQNISEGNAAVIEGLKAAGCLLKQERYEHKYPYDWRTKKPTIFRATEQWFASVEGFREKALEAIASVKWIPSQGENRITPMVAERSDWCISRQRSWGVPIPVFYDEATGEPLLNEETIAYVQKIIAEIGSDAWWELSTAELLPEKYRDNGHTYRKGTDTMDVWFDSGSSWAAVAKQRPELVYPVDMYLEGSDQHRGWFQSSLLTSVANNSIAPYKTVLTHGFTVDEQGRKMSKSLGNGIDPNEIIEGGKITLKQNGKDKQVELPAYGADVLRLWVSSVDYTNDVPLSENILKQLGDIRGKIRNTARFLLGNLHDFDPAKDAVPYEELPEIDRYMLHRMTEVFEEVTAAFESYQFFRFFQALQNFCVVDLSNFYLDIAKDRLYISAENTFRRRTCQTVMAIALENLARAIAPVLCHMAEDIWQYLPYKTPYKSVFESGWVKIEEQWKNPELAAKWQKLRQIRGEVNKVMEQARAEKMIGSSLDAKVLLYVADEELRQQLQALNPPSSLPPGIKLPEDTSQPEDDTEAIHVAVEVAPPEELALVVEKAPQKSQLSFKKVATVIGNLPDYLDEFLQKYGKSLITVGMLVTLLIVLRVVWVIVGTVNSLPLLQTSFELVGMLYSMVFVKNNLLLASDRQNLAARLKSIQTEVLDDTADMGREIRGKEKSPELEQETKVPTQTDTESQQTPITNDPLPMTNGVDELRYLLICSQVELVDSPAALEELQYKGQSDTLLIGVVKADGTKCDRCWNYSVHVGESSLHPLLCERCIPALAGQF